MFVEATELEVNLVKAVPGEGNLVELVFKTTGTPASADFQVSERVLVGLDGRFDVVAGIEIGDLKPMSDLNLNHILRAFRAKLSKELPVL